MHKDVGGSRNPKTKHMAEAEGRKQEKPQSIRFKQQAECASSKVQAEGVWYKPEAEAYSIKCNKHLY
jgi:hypothetical protein